MRPGHSLTREEVDELILPCFGSTPLTALTLFPEHFTRPFSIVHSKIFDVLDNDAIRLAALAAPRGFGKTTTLAVGFIGRKVLFREVHYIVYISSTVTEAAAKVKTLARELQDNELIKALFGDLKGVKWAEGTGEIELSDENGPFCYIQAKGAGSQIRGLKWGKYRPDIFLLDDLEDPEKVMNEELRAKLKEWFFADVLGAMDQAQNSKTRLFLIGTVLHEDSLLANLIEEGEDDEEDPALEPGVKEFLKKESFVTLRLEACDDEFHSVWPEYLSDDALRAKAMAYEKRGLLDVFYREYRNRVIAKDTASFQKKYFRYFAEDWDELQYAETVVLVDPAKTATPNAAYTALVPVSFNPSLNRIYFREYVNERLMPEEMFQRAIDLADFYNTHLIAVEVTGLNNYITWPFEQFLKKQKKFYELISIKALKEKPLRVGAMIPFYRAGHVFHNAKPEKHKVLEGQLLSFPRPKFWDVMDCAANFIEVFNLGERNFTEAVVEGETPMSEEQFLEDLRKQDREQNETVRTSKEWRCAP